MTATAVISKATLADSLTVDDTPPAVDHRETFAGTWPYRARYSTASGFPMHYIDEGGGPETLLLLHGEPT